MTDTLILGGCPAEEDTAQLGRTPDFARLNRRALEYGSPDPADPDVTTRVLTILLTSEY